MPRLPALAAALALSVAPAARGVIVLGPQGRNTAAPTGSLAGAGWQFEGSWGGFLGTAVGPHSFLTARHVGGSRGGTFTYGGAGYTATGSSDVPGTDLRLWQVRGTFPTYAPLWDAAVDGPEVGRPLFVVGRGTRRGSAVELPGVIDPNGFAGPLAGASPAVGSIAPTAREIPTVGPTGPTLSGPASARGWSHAGGDGVQTWGTNTVDAIADGGDDLGPLLAFSFDAGADPADAPNEAALSGGDSGGGLFVRDDAGRWKLAGINYGIDGPFSRTADGPTFFASLFDARGLYYDFDGSGPDPRTLIAGDRPVPGGSYASRVSSQLGTLRPLIGPSAVPEPASAGLLGVATIALLGRRRRRD